MSAVPLKKQTLSPALDPARLRKDFPILARKIHGERLVYLDNAATTQKPRQVMDAITRFYETSNANVHRGLHALSEEATAAYEGARKRVAAFIGAPATECVVFTRGTTESLNLVAYAWARRNLKAGDEIVLSVMEHHSNLVPWQMAARDTGAVLRFIPMRDDGTLDMAEAKKFFTPRTRLVSVALMANATGTIHPVADIAALARKAGALFVVDGAQGVPHMKTDVTALDCDFLAFSAHKMLGPMGVGVLYGKKGHLEAMEPFMGGGEMIREVKLEGSTWNDSPWKFEAGTPNVADAAAFPAALDYLDALGMPSVRAHEKELTAYAMEKLKSLGGLTLYGPDDMEQRGGVVSFTDAHIHPHDLSTILDRAGVAVRAGHHCAQPLMRRLGVVATIRASFYIYNDRDDVDALASAIKEARKYFGFS